jgi:hypothetical protein
VDSRIKSLIFSIIRKSLWVIAKLVKLFGVNSKILGPPSGYHESLENFIKSGIDGSKIVLEVQINGVTIGQPYNFKHPLEDHDKKEKSFEPVKIKLNMLENGRFHLNPHAVISSDDKLIFSESCCYGMNPKKHWIFNQFKLARCTKLIGKSFMLGGRANYWHLLSEEIPSIYRLNNNGLDTKDFDHLIVHESKYSFQKEIYELLGIPQKRFVELKNYQHIECEELFFFSPTYQPDMEALAWTRDFLLNFTRNTARKSRRLFICRENSNSKKIINNTEVKNILSKYDFEIFKPENHSVIDQIIAFKNAKFVIGAHGAALSNLMFCEANTHVIEIRSKYHYGSFSAPHVYMWYKELNNLKYSILSSDIRESKSLKGRSKMDSDFIIDIPRLDNLIKFHLDNE